MKLGGLKRRLIVAISLDGEMAVHLPCANGNSATLCGLDGHDCGQEMVRVPAGARVDCVSCWQIFALCREYRGSDFIAANPVPRKARSSRSRAHRANQERLAEGNSHPSNRRAT